MDNEIISSVWPEWSVVKQLGRGAYGSVYEAVRNDYSVESKAAIKVITIPANESEVESLRADGLSENDTKSYLSGIVNDFVSEIQLMESFKGVQNIVSVEDYKVIEHTDRVGWTILIRMELLTPLNSFIGDDMLPEKAVIQLGIDMCQALEICAMRKVIHRDIKPENIFVNAFGDYKLGDFGVARKLENVAGALSQKGTYNYMAPEVEKGIAYNETVDLYSLGLVLYRFVNRKLLPFLTPETNMSPNERMAAVRRRLDGEALPAPCDASPALAEVILRACAYQPGLRFQSAKEMKQALQAVLNGTFTSPQAAGFNPVTPKMPVEEPVVDLDRTVSVRHAPGAGAPPQTGMGMQPGSGMQPTQGPGQAGMGMQSGQTPPGQDIYAAADGLDRTMSVRHAPGTGMNSPQYAGPQTQAAPQYGNQPQNYTPNPYAGESTIYRGQVGEFGEKKPEKPKWKKIVKIILIVVAVWWGLGLILSIIFGVIFMNSDSDTDTGTETETTAEAPVADDSGVEETTTAKEVFASEAEGPSLQDFDWFMSFILAHGDEDIPNVEYILRGDELNGSWKCLISEGSDNADADISAFFDCPGILCNMEIDMTDNKGTVTGYPHLLVEDAKHQTKDERDPFSYDCSFENMVLSAESSEGESFYCMFYRDGSTVRGYGSYYLSDDTEMGIMLTR